MRRREFLSLVSGTIALWPLAANAQQPTTPVVGFLGVGPGPGSLGRTEALGVGLQEFGYVDGKNVLLEFRFAESLEQIHKFAVELAQSQPAVIVTSGNAATEAVKSVTSTIPIIFSIADDPVQLGLVASLNRPGGHMTGVSLISGALSGKRLDLLHELVPAVNLVAILINPNNPAEKNARDAQEKGREIGLQILTLTATTEREIETAFEKLGQQRAGALLVNADAFFTGNRDRITALAARYRIPAIYAWGEFAEAGGLMSYGTSLADGYRQMGLYVGKVLRGVKPAELPVVQPTRTELVINLKTSKSLGLEIPAKLLALADAVIE
jgi:putative tryptophan/tyrosine transport system substrate-binding protein